MLFRSVGDELGYDAVQLGFMDKARRKATRPERGHVAAEFVSNRRKAMQSAGVQLPPKANVEPQRYIREFRIDGALPIIKYKEADGSERCEERDDSDRQRSLPLALELRNVHLRAGQEGQHDSGEGADEAQPVRNRNVGGVADHDAREQLDQRDGQADLDRDGRGEEDRPSKNCRYRDVAQLYLRSRRTCCR